jgi:hypothetical protein
LSIRAPAALPGTIVRFERRARHPFSALLDSSALRAPLRPIQTFVPTVQCAPPARARPYRVLRASTVRRARRRRRRARPRATIVRRPTRRRRPRIAASRATFALPDRLRLIRYDVRVCVRVKMCKALIYTCPLHSYETRLRIRARPARGARPAWARRPSVRSGITVVRSFSQSFASFKKCHADFRYRYFACL